MEGQITLQEAMVIKADQMMADPEYAELIDEAIAKGVSLKEITKAALVLDCILQVIREKK